MKNIKKILALALAICFFAIIPLTAAASSAYDTYLIGNWEVYEVYDGSEKKTQKVMSGMSTLQVNSDGTAKWKVNSDWYDGTWSYSKTDSYGYWFNWDVDNAGTTVHSSLVYITIDGANKGDVIATNNSSILFIFHKV